MPLPTRVVISDNVLLSCLTHALTTEREEIIGFCLGGQVGDVGYVWETCVRPRSDKQSDRVEVAPEDQIEAAQEAERVSGMLGVETKVAGWYHSHPRITCPPSHVDLRTQATLQQYGINIGLIFSVFNTPTQYKQRSSRVQLHCFQTASGNQPLSLPVHVEPQHAMLSRFTPTPPTTPLYTKVARLVEVLVEEENLAYDAQISRPNLTPSGRVHAGCVYTKTIENLSAGYFQPLSRLLTQRPSEVEMEKIETATEELKRMIKDKKEEREGIEVDIIAFSQRFAELQQKIDEIQFPG